MLNTQYLELLKSQLAKLATQANFETVLTTAFGTKIDLSKVSNLRQQWLHGDFSLIPPIDILSDGELGTANGGYAASEDKIFVSSDFIAQSQNNSNAVTELLLEEFGHKLDRFFNGNVDSPGDEGAIFRLLATGQTLSPQTLAGLRAQDDHAVIAVNGRSIAIEKQDFYGDAGDNTLIGTSGNDAFFPETGADTIDGGGGNDFLRITNFGDLDNITITYTNVNAGKITGGSNNGTKFKNIESVFLYTGFGNDVINISATTADSTINSGNGDDIITGGAGNDTINSEGGSNTVNGGAGNDSIFLAGNGNQKVNGGAGNDRIATGDGNDTISGGTEDDVILAGNGNNNIKAGAGNDYISAGTGNDTVNGGSGNDNIEVGTGTETVDGGSGNDSLSLGYNYGDTDVTTITYTNVNAGTITGGLNNGTKFQNIESLSLTTGSGNDVINISAATGNSGINVGDGNNTVTGGNGNDFIVSGVGNDTISGGGGDDTIFVGTGIDNVNGGGGNDSLGINNYGDLDNITITYTNTTAGTITGGLNNGTKFKNIESVNFTTSSGNDVINISAATGNSTIIAGDGNNTVTGGKGNDLIVSGTGDDNISGGCGNDNINVVTGNDTVNGGGGIDSLSIGYNSGDTDDTIITYTNVNAGTIAGGSNNGTKFKNIESVNFTTGSGNDVINISAATGDSSIDTGNGNDTVTGGAGNDNINVGTGTDIVDGGDGNDFLSIGSNSGDTDDTIITYTNVNAGTIAGGSNNGTTFKNIESLSLTTGSGNDVINISATTGDSFIGAGEGNDTVTGSVGNDNINAGGGNNTVVGAAGDDYLSAGNGTNTVTGDAGNDTIVTGTGDDIISGGVGNDTINAGAGNDTIDGGTGNDIIYAGAGNNTISGGNDDDIYYINSKIDIGTTTINETTTGGVDTIDFSNSIDYRTRSAIPVNVDLSLTTIQTIAPNLQLVIPVISLENVRGTIRDDILTGNSLNNTLIGNAGNDILTGGGGNDRFLFSGSNPFTRSNAITAQLGKDTITDFTTGQDKIVLSKANFTAITTAVGASLGTNFATVADDSLAGDSGASIVYSQQTGNLFYNQNGADAGYGNGGNFAVVSGIPALAATDFTVVA